MKNAMLHIFAGAALLVGSMASMAATMDITASFSPSMDNPDNNMFINTTALSGYCAQYPQQCQDTNMFSIGMAGITASLATSGFTANSEPRMGMYFKMPGAWRDITLTNQETGATSNVRFRVSGFSATYRVSGWTLSQHGGWNGGSFVFAPSPCSYSGVGLYAAEFYSFMWKWPTSDAACYKTSNIDLTGEPYLITNTSLGYELNMPEPLKMESGIYAGSLSMNVGPEGDIDFGDNFTPSDTVLHLNFALSVNHELKLATTADAQQVSLQPCTSGKTCTEDEGSANWERWMITRITPELTGKSNFNLSSSGAFAVYLQCEQQSGSDCALTSDSTPSQTVPVQAFLTLPSNIVDNATDSTVTKRRLSAGRDLTTNIFATKVFGQNKAGSIDFLVSQKDVDTMLKTRPDIYRGAVTVIFDPQIY